MYTDDVSPLRVRVDDGPPQTIKLRQAQILRGLLRAGTRGITKADYPGVHVGARIAALRDKHGVKIETQRPESTGPVKGTYGRYVLQSKIEVVREEAQA
jgi:hypothetical protein